MGAFTYRALSPLSQSGSCVQTDNLSSNRPLLFDSALTCRHAIRMSPNIFPCSFFIHSHPALSSRGQVQTPTQGKGPGMTEYQRSWLDSFFGGFLSPFLPIYACGPVCVSVCDDEPWCQMALFVCVHARVRTTQPLRRSLQLADMNILIIAAPTPEQRHRVLSSRIAEKTITAFKKKKRSFVYLWRSSLGVTVDVNPGGGFKHYTPWSLKQNWMCYFVGLAGGQLCVRGPQAGICCILTLIDKQLCPSINLTHL